MHKRCVYRSNDKLHPIGINLACMLILYRTRNPMFGFSKYEFSNTLLGGINFFRIMSGVTQTQPYIS